MPEGTPPVHDLSRRRFLARSVALGGASLAALLAGCSARPSLPSSTAHAEVATPTPEPTPAPPPLRARGREDFALMAGTAWEAPGVAIHSGVRGTRVMILGGVHGNEPGGWLAAEGIAGWEVAQGDLLVVPRANRLSDAAMERTLPGFGDLNRLYPGDPNGPPMARMAHEIVRYAQAFQPHYLLDLHESWAFYNERGSSNGTAFLGQTVAVGVRGTAVDVIGRAVDEVNTRITHRERLVLRTTNNASGIPSGPQPGGQPAPSGPVQTPTTVPGATPNRAGGATSLAIGNWVKNCAPVLIEMGQIGQPDARRAYLHQLLVETVMGQSGML